MDYPILENLKPYEFFKWFGEICKIPHGTYNEKQMTDFLIKFAEDRNIKYTVDAKGNVFMKLPASKGYENQPSILLQAHTDMVCVKDEGVEFDFEKDSIRLKITDDKLHAEGTTLGADNGVGVATMLAIADSDYVLHPELELLFTVEEECGLWGIRNFDMSLIKARRMINMDCGYSHIIAVSSLGTRSATVSREFKMQDTDKDHTALKIRIYGGLGGHAGIMARKGRACAAHNMGILLSSIREFSPCLCSLESTSPISKWCTSTIVVKSDFVDKVKGILIEKFSGIYSIYEKCDPDIKIEIEEVALPDKCISAMDTEDIVNLLRTVKSGINREDGQNNFIVITLTIFGKVSLENGVFSGSYVVRSSNDADMENLYKYYKNMLTIFGFTVSYKDQYSGWKEAVNSPFRDKCIAIHQNLFGFPPEFENVQGGIEIAIIVGEIPDMDAVGFAPTARGAHTTSEYIRLSEVPDFWQWMLGVLREKE